MQVYEYCIRALYQYQGTSGGPLQLCSALGRGLE